MHSLSKKKKKEHLTLAFPSALTILLLGCRLSPVVLGGLQRIRPTSSRLRRCRRRACGRAGLVSGTRAIEDFSEHGTMLISDFLLTT